MEVENVGKKPNRSAKKMTTKTKWIILFSVLGTVIVGLVIAIIVVAVAKNTKPEPIHSDLSEGEVYDEYFKTTDEINAGIENENYDANQVLETYREKIKATKDETVRLMLEKDYYYLLSISSNDDVKEEVLDALVIIDDRLQTVVTALAVVNRAEYYGETELADKYNNIANERMGFSEEEIEGLKHSIEKIVEEETNTEGSE